MPGILALEVFSCFCLLQVRDLLYDVTGCHPVTYADTRLTGQGEVPVERVLTNSPLGWEQLCHAVRGVFGAWDGFTP